MGKQVLPPQQILNLSFGTKAEKKEEILKRQRSKSKLRRGRSRSRRKSENSSRGPLDNAVLVQFLPLIPENILENAPSQEEPVKLWNSFFKEPKKVRPDKILSFFKPTLVSDDEVPVVLAPEEAVNRERKKWERCLVAYVVGKRPHYPALKAALIAQWKLRNQFQMNSIEGGFFLFRFFTNEDRDRVLLEGPWNVFGRPIVLKQWNPGLKIQKENFNALPVWIRLPKLDFSLWDNEILGRIASIVGQPRFIDDSTANRERFDYARICVEISPQCKFPTRVKILVGSLWLEQAIFYEWYPTVCSHCDSFEHEESKCQNKGASLSKSQSNQPNQEEIEHGMVPEKEQGWTEVHHRKNVRFSKTAANSNPSGQTWREKQNLNETCSSSAIQNLNGDSTNPELIQDTLIVHQPVGDNVSPLLERDNTEGTKNITNGNALVQIVKDPVQSQELQYSLLQEGGKKCFLDQALGGEAQPGCDTINGTPGSDDIEYIESMEVGDSIVASDADAVFVQNRECQVNSKIKESHGQEVSRVLELAGNNNSERSSEEGSTIIAEAVGNAGKAVSEKVVEPFLAILPCQFTNTSFLNYKQSTVPPWPNHQSDIQPSSKPNLHAILPCQFSNTSFLNYKQSTTPPWPNHQSDIQPSSKPNSLPNPSPCPLPYPSPPTQTGPNPGPPLLNPSKLPNILPREKSALLQYFAINNREVSALSEEEDRESGPPGFNSGMDKSSEENSMETAIHVTEETSSSKEEINGFSCSRARMVREKLGISVLSTDNADKAFTEFCRNRQKEIEIIRKKSVVPDVSINLKKHVGKKGYHTRRIVEGGKKKVRL